MRLVVGIKRDDDPAKHSQECGKETSALFEDGKSEVSSNKRTSNLARQLPWRI